MMSHSRFRLSTRIYWEEDLLLDGYIYGVYLIKITEEYH